MKTVIQRVKSASVTVDGQHISSIGRGLLVFAGVARDDTAQEVESMAHKVLRARLWDSPSTEEGGGGGGRWKCNVQDIGGEILCVSQFTLLASTKKASPDFHRSAPPGPAKELYDRFVGALRAGYKDKNQDQQGQQCGSDKVKDGVFQAMMDVALVNDGPVTILIETNPPPMDNPTPGLDLPEDATVKTKIQKRFELPASLLE